MNVILNGPNSDLHSGALKLSANYDRPVCFSSVRICRLKDGIWMQSGFGHSSCGTTPGHSIDRAPYHTDTIAL